MGFFRNFYDYMIRENWLIMTGRLPQAVTEANGRAEAELEVEKEEARARPRFQKYLAEIEAWKESFGTLVSKMEEEGGHRKVLYTIWDFWKLPKAPEVQPPFGYPKDHLVQHELWVETTHWRKARIDQAKDRLGIRDS